MLSSISMLDLNPQQKIAAQHVEGPMLVLAGAGSGKTRVVAYRCAHLLSIGIPAGEILALTFTNKAADEMGNRIRSLADRSVLTSTFHSLGARILRESIHILGYSNDFTIYDENDSQQLIKQSLASLGYKAEKGTVKTLKVGISNCKNGLLEPRELKDDPLLEQIFTAYQNKLREYNALDFDDLLYLTAKLFQNHPDILEMYQKRWSFILIDEYQDTNAAQYSMTKMLSARHNNLFAVGDPDQSIYSWRGANLNNILNFEEDYEGAHIITLEQNYRSTSTILAGANSLIEHNEGRYEKRLWSTLGTGEKIGVYQARNEREEAEFVIVELSKRAQEAAIPLRDCAILYRTNAQSRSLEDTCLKYNLPYTIIGGLSFYQRREIKDILALLRMVISDTDFLSFARTINLPKRGVGASTLTKLRDLAEQKVLPILTLCRALLAGEITDIKLSKKQREGISDYLGVINRLKELTREDLSIGAILKKAIEESRYLQVIKEDPETFDDRKSNLDELINKAEEWSSERENPQLSKFLEELALKASSDETPLPDSIKLMTLHNAKGLEFRLVFLVGMEEDLCPHVNSKDSPDALEEERRLCYVGMTRAKEHLYLTGSSYRMIWGSPKVMRPSRFIGEIAAEYLSILNESDDGWSEVETGEDAFAHGTTVFHRDFGKGVIQKSYSTSMGVTYDIFFYESSTTRSLVAKYAKLTVQDPF